MKIFKTVNILLSADTDWQGTKPLTTQEKRLDFGSQGIYRCKAVLISYLKGTFGGL